MKFLRTLDPFITFPLLGLAGFSLSLIYSTVPGLFGDQLTFFFIGFIFYVISGSMDAKIIRNFAVFFYLLSIFLLLVSFFGPSVRGASRWIYIGSKGFQPSEVVKPFLIIAMAALIESRPPNNIKNILLSLVMILIPALIIFKQPDLGNVIIYLMFFSGMIFQAGISIYLVGATVIMGIFLIPFSWHFLQTYQRNRILSFLNPYNDPQGAGYNALQAIIAIGSGQLMGLGLGRGTQSHLLFLPEHHTDFIFASLGEEFGMVGGILLLIFFFILLFRMLKITFDTHDNFYRFVSLGIFLQILSQLFINVGMNIGLLPITGITLPLVSYGGSSVISTMLGLGFVSAISRDRRGQVPLVIK